MKRPMTLQEMLEKRKTSTLMRETFSASMATPVIESTEELARTEDFGKIVNSESETSIVRTYRALSAAVLPGRFIDFPEKILKSAQRFFKTRDNGSAVPVFKDHNRSVDAWLGKVSSTYWDKGNESIPSGVNSIIEFDRAAIGTVIERGLLTGGLNSVSVTVDFEWKPSHPDMEIWDFYNKLGDEVNGELVRIVATKIVGIYEISLVWEGADPFAKEVAAVSPEPDLTNEANIKEPHSAIDGNRETESNTISLAKEDHMDQILQALAEKFSLNYEGEPENETIQKDLLAAIDTLNSQVEQFKADKQTQEETLTAKDAKITALEAELTNAKKVVDATLSQLQEKLAVNAKLTMGTEEAASPIIKLAAKLGLDDLYALANEYEKRAEQLYPLRCQECGCANVSRQSSSFANANVGIASSVDVIGERDIHQLEKIHLAKR